MSQTNRNSLMDNSIVSKSSEVSPLKLAQLTPTKYQSANVWRQGDPTAPTLSTRGERFKYEVPLTRFVEHLGQLSSFVPNNTGH